MHSLKNYKLMSAAAEDEHALLICDLPDPEDLCSDCHEGGLHEVIHGHSWRKWCPAEYEQKSENGMIVLVTAYMKLYASIICANSECWLTFCCVEISWCLKPNTRERGDFRGRDGEQNGTCIYQLTLNEIQMLPIADESKITLLENKVVDSGTTEGNSSGKRKVKATDVDRGSS
jgi:hypothetical protein